MEPVNKNFDVHFGKVGKAVIDWRNINMPDENDDNDEDLTATEDIISITGIDPDKLL